MTAAGRAPRFAALRSAVGTAWSTLVRRPRVTGRLGQGRATPGGPVPLGAHAEDLLSLGRERAFLDAVTTPGVRVGARAVGSRLVALGALSTAAAFVQRCPPGLAEVNLVRAEVRDAARAAANAVSLRAEPAGYADAVLALLRLEPDSAARDEPVARAESHLVSLARGSAMWGEVDAALAALTWAARLRPDDRVVLGRLAEAAARAGDAWRREDTLLRLRDLDGDEAHLTAGVVEAVAAGRWKALADRLDRVERDGVARAAVREVIAAQRAALGARFSRFSGEADWPGGLGLVGALAGWIAVSTWPETDLAGLLALARRRLRDPRSLADPAVWPVPEFILRIAPDDVDMGRLVGRNRLRQRRLREAARRLGRALEIDPHGARDWLDLASAHDRLGQKRDRDVCLARALAIDPASLPKPTAEAFWVRMAAA